MQADFDAALGEVKPAFGANTEGLARHMTHGVLDYGDAYRHLASTLRTLVSQARSRGRGCTSVYSSICQYTSVYSSICQYTSVYSSICQYTSVYSSICQYTSVSAAHQPPVLQCKHIACMSCAVFLGFPLRFKADMSTVCCKYLLPRLPTCNTALLPSCRCKAVTKRRC
jgi:hypothetical protein